MDLNSGRLYPHLCALAARFTKEPAPRRNQRGVSRRNPRGIPQQQLAARRDTGREGSDALTTYPLWWQHQAGGAFNTWAAAARRRSPRQSPLPLRAEALGSHSLPRCSGGGGGGTARGGHIGPGPARPWRHAWLRRSVVAARRPRDFSSEALCGAGWRARRRLRGGSKQRRGATARAAARAGSWSGGHRAAAAHARCRRAAAAHARYGHALPHDLSAMAFLMAATFQPSVALAVDRGSTEAFIFFTIDSAMRSSSGSESDLFRNRRAILEFLKCLYSRNVSIPGKMSLFSRGQHESRELASLNPVRSESKA